MKGFTYNTQQGSLILKEYGRNVQKLANYIITIEDRDKRNRFAQILVELMRQIHPNMRDSQDYANKIWDDLYIVSGFNLEVDSPFPLPEKTLLGKKPKMVAYNTHKLGYRHYGRNIEILIDKAIQMEDPDQKRASVIYIGRLMKTFYSTWNKENVDDIVIVEHLNELSKGKLKISLDEVRAEGLFDLLRERGNERDRGDRDRNRQPSGGQNQKKNNQKRMPDNRKKNNR